MVKSWKRNLKYFHLLTVAVYFFLAIPIYSLSPRTHFDPQDNLSYCLKLFLELANWLGNSKPVIVPMVSLRFLDEDVEESTLRRGYYIHYGKRIGYFAAVSIGTVEDYPQVYDRIKERFQRDDEDVLIYMMGSTILIDERLKDFIPQNIQEHFRPGQVLYLDYGTIRNFNYGRWTAPVVAALEGLNLSEMTGIDFGASEGVLSLIMLRQGAEHVVAIDSHELSKAQIDHNIGNNHLRGEIAFVQENISDVEPMKKKIGAFEIANGVVVANLGAFYGSADFRAMEIAASLDGIHTVILGGYQAFHPVFSSFIFPTRKMEGMGFDFIRAYYNPYYHTVALVFERKKTKPPDEQEKEVAA